MSRRFQARYGFHAAVAAIVCLWLAPPARGADCTCYFSYHDECPVGWSCSRDYQEFSCTRMQPKGGAVFGGCTEAVPLQPCAEDGSCPNEFLYKCVDGQCIPKISGCDGRCAPADEGSSCGLEEPYPLSVAVGAWAEAIVQTGLGGGGEISPQLDWDALAATDLGEECGVIAARTALSVFEMCGGRQFVEHPTHLHQVEDHRVGDLRKNACPVDAVQACFGILLPGLAYPGEPAKLMGAPASCRDGIPVSQGCAGADDPIACLSARLRDAITLLTTPPALRSPDQSTEP